MADYTRGDAPIYKGYREAWKYYTYPCNECKRRVKDHYVDAEDALAGEEDSHAKA